MDAIIMNSENSKTSDSHWLILNLSDKKFKISARTWNDKFELPDASYSISDIQDYSDYIIKKHEAHIAPSVKFHSHLINMTREKMSRI